MRHNIFVIVSALLGAAPCAPARADLFFYTTRASFDAANPGLPAEGFEAARVNPGSFTTVAPPVSAATNDGVFQPGDIRPGLTVGDSGGSLVVLGTGAVAGTTKAVGAGSFTADAVLGFAPAVTAVGTDLFAAPGPGPTVAEPFEVSVFGPSGFLGMTTVSEPAGGVAFFGVSSTAGPITQVTLHDSGNNAATFVDNVAFGAAGAAVPEPSSLALAGLSGFAAAALLTSRRRRKAVPAPRA